MDKVHGGRRNELAKASKQEYTLMLDLQSRNRFPFVPSDSTNFFRYGVRNLEKAISFSLKSCPSERFHWPEMSQIKAEPSYQRKVDFS